MFKTILVPIDGSPLSDRVINAATQFARETSTSLVGLSVAESYPFSPLSADTFPDERSCHEEKAREIRRNASARSRRLTQPSR